MNNIIEDNIGHQQVGEDLQKLRAEEQRAIQDKQATRFAFNLTIFRAYTVRLAHLTPEGVRESVALDFNPDSIRRIDFSNVPDSKFQISRKIFKHDKTGETLFDHIGIIDGVSQSEIIDTEAMRFAVKHLDEKPMLPEQIFNLICPEFYKVPGVSSPNGMKPDWISMLVVNELQLESIKALL